MSEAGSILSEAADELAPDEWEHMRTVLAEVLCTIGDDVLYPVRDMYPGMAKHLRLPAAKGKVRRWGPRRRGTVERRLEHLDAHPGIPGRRPR
ncbi:MAG: hypothetical protein U0183_16215 [Polyangiaceae bacterium]